MSSPGHFDNLRIATQVRMRRSRDLEPLPDGAWVFLPERISRHPADPPDAPTPVLLHGSAVVSRRDE